MTHPEAGRDRPAPPPLVPPAVPPVVAVANVLLVVGGGIAALGGLLSLVAFHTADHAGFLTGVVPLVLGGLSVYLGLQLAALVPWARTAVLALEAVQVLADLLALGRSPVASVVGLAISAGIVYLLFRPEARSAFGG